MAKATACGNTQKSRLRTAAATTLALWIPWLRVRMLFSGPPEISYANYFKQNAVPRRVRGNPLANNQTIPLPEREGNAAGSDGLQNGVPKKLSKNSPEQDKSFERARLQPPRDIFKRRKGHPPGAKAPVIFGLLAARLKSCPFKTSFFGQVLRSDCCFPG